MKIFHLPKYCKMLSNHCHKNMSVEVVEETCKRSVMWMQTELKSWNLRISSINTIYDYLSVYQFSSFKSLSVNQILTQLRWNVMEKH